MKGAILAVVMLLAQAAAASPYFRFLGHDETGYHPTTAFQGYFDPSGKNTTDYGTSLALFSHSTKDGAIFQRLQADWSPLAVAAGGNLKGAFVAAGPSANLAPATKAVLLNMLEAITKEDAYLSLKSLLSPDKSKPDVTGSYGAAWLTKPIQDGQLLAISKWQGRFGLSAGIAWVWK